MSMHNTPEFIKKNISIVLQGSLNKDNLIDIANYCAHWRDILPNSEIILSISTSDILLFKHSDAINLNHVIPYLPEDTANAFHNAVNALKFYCNKIIYNEKSLALPLPPLKKNTKKQNNINFQIESSFNGVREASHKFCLCIRNDAIFRNTNFINIYLKNYNLLRHAKTSILKQRLLISWIFTANPFANFESNPFVNERIPLHPSDWFQFGLTQDVQKLWDIPFYTYSDALYFENKTPPSPTISEKRFRTRFAVEQYICLQAFQNNIDELNINYFNDLTSRNLAMDLLIDNFIICSDEALSLRINKQYQADLTSPRKRSTCITSDAWHFMILNRDIEYQKILTGNVDENIKKLSNNDFLITPFNDENISEIHLKNQKTFLRGMIFSILNKLLPGTFKDKFLYRPESFFKDAKISLIKIIGNFYLK